MGNSMGTIIQNIGNIVVSDRKLSLFSDIQTELALSKWPPIGLKFCMVASRSVIFKIRLVLEGSEILRYMVISCNNHWIAQMHNARTAELIIICKTFFWISLTIKNIFFFETLLLHEPWFSFDNRIFAKIIKCNQPLYWQHFCHYTGI
jgi:hypothetical protein